MNIALSYYHDPMVLTRFIETAFQQSGHTVYFVGPPSLSRPGYHSGIPVSQLLTRELPLVDFYFWIESGNRFFPVGIEDSPVPTACYLIDLHLGTWREEVAKFFDIVFVAHRDQVERYQQIVGHPHVYWLPLAVPTDVFAHRNLPKIYDVGFVGIINRAHRNTPRSRHLHLVSERYTMNDQNHWYNHDEICTVYNQSRIVLNTSIAGELTQRIIEGVGSGSFVLTDTRPEALGDFLEWGSEIVGFSDDQDLLDKIDYYLANVSEREAIAAKAYQTAHRRHTVQHRADQVVEIVQSGGGALRAPMRTASSDERLATRIPVYRHLHMLDALFDDLQAAHRSPLQRLWQALPVIARRTLI